MHKDIDAQVHVHKYIHTITCMHKGILYTFKCTSKYIHKDTDAQIHKCTRAQEHAKVHIYTHA